jgi:hypothetical protein
MRNPQIILVRMPERKRPLAVYWKKILKSILKMLDMKVWAP